MRVRAPSTPRAPAAGGPPSAVAVRPARAGDAPAIVALLREVYAPFQAEFRPTALREDEASVGARPDAWLVAEDGDGLAGAVQHGPEGDDHTFCFLAVRPDRRRRGVGSLLVEHVVALAAAAGCPTVLIAVRSSLGENVAFFERRGFRRVGPFGTGHHDVYARELAAP